jgi:hypothetical protein
MDTTARWTKKIGWALFGFGIAVWIFGSFLMGPGSESDFRLITCAFFFYVPGVLLAVLGHLLEQVDERFRSLEQKIDSLRGPAAQSKEGS